MKLTQAEIMSILRGESNGVDKGYFQYFGIDSRRMQERGLFFAIKGVHTDGHEFIDDAAKHGATGCIVEKNVRRKDIFVYRVSSVKSALGNLGSFARNEFSGKVIGITGSAGKTTTKELVASVLTHFYDVSKTLGNANTEFSIPLFFLNGLSLQSNFAVVEMGVQKKGDMDVLNKIAKPDIAILLNASRSHLEFLGSVSSVAEEKFKLARFVASKYGTVIINGDDAHLAKLAEEHLPNYISFGFKGHNFVKARIVKIEESSMSLQIFIGDAEKYDMYFPFSGIHYAYDVLATVSLALALQLPMGTVLKHIGEFSPLSGRGKEIVLSGNRTIVDETYNANPLSLEYSLSRFKNRKRKLYLVIGDMLELGVDAVEIHRESGRIIASFKPDFLVTLGKLSKNISDEVKRIIPACKTFHFDKKGDIVEFLKRIDIPENTVIFIKGSRGAKMEDIIKILVERYGR